MVGGLSELHACRQYLFDTPELSAALLLFYRQIMTLARSYDWLKGVLPLVLGWHKYVVICSPLDPSN